MDHSPMTTSWYCQIERTTYGPLTAQDLKRMAEKGKLRPTDLIKKTEAGKWVTASSVKGLLFKPAAQAVLNLSVKQIATTTDRTCPNCRSTVEVGSVLCMGCGYNFLAGKSHAKAVSPKKHGRRGLGLAGIASGLLMAICLTIYLIDFRGRQAPRDTPQVIAQSPGLGSQKEPDGKSANKRPARNVINGERRSTGRSFGYSLSVDLCRVYPRAS